MEDFAWLLRRVLQRILWVGVVAFPFCGVVLAQAVAVSPRWSVSFAGSEVITTASPLADGSMLVTVLPAGASPANVHLKRGNVDLAVKWSACDPVSRLVFLAPEEALEVRCPQWIGRARDVMGEAYVCSTTEGILKGVNEGWVKQRGEKVLPFALLRVSFDQLVPPVGTPLLDEQGRVAALLFQGADKGKAAYAIPAEAVLRVQQDIASSGKWVRGWLGLTLRPENQAPIVVKVAAGSPADQVGICPNDILLEVGGRVVTNYPDAANAFFYLSPGRPVRLKFLRGSQRWEITATPILAARE